MITSKITSKVIPRVQSIIRPVGDSGGPIAPWLPLIYSQYRLLWSIDGYSVPTPDNPPQPAPAPNTGYNYDNMDVELFGTHTVIGTVEPENGLTMDEPGEGIEWAGLDDTGKYHLRFTANSDVLVETWDSVDGEYQSSTHGYGEHYLVLENTAKVRITHAGLSGVVTYIDFVSLRLDITPQDITYDFQAGDELVGQGSVTIRNDGWYLDGSNGVRSRGISHSQETSLYFDVDGSHGFNKLRIKTRVSSESGYDKMYFYINGAGKFGPNSGAMSRDDVYDITPGQAVELRCRYTKDRSADGGSDSMFVQYLMLYTE